MAKVKILFLTLALYSCLNNQALGQSNSVLASGTWIKLAIDTDNIYKLTYADFESYGLDPTSIDPASIRIFGNGSGMLPQANSVSRPSDIEEVSVIVSGQDDGVFDQGD